MESNLPTFKKEGLIQIIARKELEKFVHVYINSFEKWDLAVFTANHFMEPLSVNEIVDRVGRNQRGPVEKAIEEFLHTGVLLKKRSQQGYKLSPNSSYIPILREFAYSLDDREDRFLLLSEVLHNMHKMSQKDSHMFGIIEAAGDKETHQRRCWEIVHEASPTGISCRSCLAYINQRHCWEVDERPCTNSPAVCILINCPAYLEYKEEIESRLAEKGLLDAIEQVEAVAEKKCWQIRGCSSNAIVECEKKKTDADCWDNASCSCDVKQKMGCDCCPIYIFHVLHEKRSVTF